MHSRKMFTNSETIKRSFLPSGHRNGRAISKENHLGKDTLWNRTCFENFSRKKESKENKGLTFNQETQR